MIKQVILFPGILCLGHSRVSLIITGHAVLHVIPYGKRNIVGGDIYGRHGNDEFFNQVFQLLHIARPVVVDKRLKRAVIKHLFSEPVIHAEI